QADAHLIPIAAALQHVPDVMRHGLAPGMAEVRVNVAIRQLVPADVIPRAAIVDEDVRLAGRSDKVLLDDAVAAGAHDAVSGIADGEPADHEVVLLVREDGGAALLGKGHLLMLRIPSVLEAEAVHLAAAGGARLYGIPRV